MTAQVFPIAKKEVNSNDITYVYPGLEELDNKIREVEEKLLPSMPKDEEEAYAQLKEMKHKLLEMPTTLKRTPEQEFEDKMKLFQIKPFFKDNEMEMHKAFPFMTYEIPRVWADAKYSIERLIQIGIKGEIDYTNRTRYPKPLDLIDHCVNLANSLQNDKGWEKGQARDAFKLVMSCYEMFPFDFMTANAIYEMVNFLSDFYVFANFTSNGVGIPMFIQTIKQQKIHFESNFRFHDYLSRLVSSTGDAHCSYRASCYEQFIFVQPLFFRCVHINKAPKIYLAKISIPALEEWIDAEVITIDAWDAETYISKFSHSLGLAYSPDVVFNYALTRRYWNSKLNDFTLDRGQFLLRTRLPKRPFMIYSLKKPGSESIVEIKIDWLIFKADTLKIFNDQYTYWNLHCASKPFIKKSVKIQKRSSLLSSLGPQPQLSPSTMKLSLQRRSISLGETTIIKKTYEGVPVIVTGPEFAFLVIDDSPSGKYAVLVINSFNVVDIQSWYFHMQRGFQYLIDNAYTRLILDLSGNSGGVICLAYSLLAVLSPSTELAFPATKRPYPTVTSVTAMLQKFSICAVEADFVKSPLRIQSFLNENRTEFPETATWLDNTLSYSRKVGGFTRGSTTFSAFLIDSCQGKETSLLKNVRPAFETLIVLSDGFCGSSCAILAANLQESGNPAVVVLPRVLDIVNAYSFAGGQVISMDNVKDVAKRSSCYDLVPQVMEQISTTITYRCIFSVTRPDIPLEYFMLPANSTIMRTALMADSMLVIWKNVLSVGLDIKQNPEKYHFETNGVNLMGGSIY